MLPQKYNYGALLGLLLLSISGEFALAEKSRSSQWQDGPINCYVCKDLAECTTSLGTVRKCENNDAQSCVTVFDATGFVVERGCSDTVYANYNTHCIANPEYCPTCGSSGCNEANSLEAYSECLYCDSADSPDCVWNPASISSTKLCDGGCMTALYPVKNTTTGVVQKYNLARSCLNDRDLDDREKCASGNDPKCVTCTTEKCNTHKLPETRNSCYYCVDSCEDAEIRECITVSEDNKCYILYDKTNELVGMGCSSDLKDSVTDLIKQKLLYQCDGNDCNSYQNIPKVHDCTKCNSGDMEICATKPSSVQDDVPCRIRPYTQCYQSVNEDGHTERGCLGDLESDKFYACLTSNDGKCKICSEDNCNEELIPENRKKCHRCNSEVDETCHNAPNSLSVCPLYVEDESCISTYMNGVTKRDCKSELTCADTGTCKECSSDGCNTVNLRKPAEEIYGMFQDLPLNCFSCTGASCLTSLGSVNMCSGKKEQDCITVFDISGQVMRRGCETEVDEEFETYCNANPELCFNCKSNGCNTFTSASGSQSCLYCDATKNRDCLFNPNGVTMRRNCIEGCVSSLYTRKSNPLIQDFVRTCFEDIELDDREACTAANNCIKCTNDNCNVDIVPTVQRKSCYHCSGNDCSSPVAQQCVSYMTTDQCYIYFDPMSFLPTRMGCKSDLLVDGIQSNQKFYYLCDEDNCNNQDNLPEKKKCVTCNSWVDTNCATDPSKGLTIMTCDLAMDDCYVRVTADGLTVRGCTSVLDNDLYTNCTDGSNNMCSVCTSNDCNVGLYPADRTSCYRCDSESDPKCDSIPTTTEVCPLYSSSESCITKIANGRTFRGCGSEMNCNNAGRKSCRSCTGNNCNNLDLLDQYIGNPGIFQDLPLNCYHCSGTECSTSLGNVNKCESNLYDTCTTAFASNGTIVARGCSAALENACLEEGNSCYDCKSNGCNSVYSESVYVDCIFCDGRLSSACVNDAASVQRIRSCNKGCMSAYYPRTNDVEPAYDLLRTCLDDMDLDDQDKCQAGKNSKCVSCTSQRCNTDSLLTHKSCYQCTGTECKAPKTDSCRSIMDNDQCFVQFDENGEIARMGCRSDYDPFEIRDYVTQQLMWLCNADNCNTIENLPASQSCALCSSRTDADCSISPENITGTTSCDKLPYTECYSRVLESGHSERGCLSSLTGDDFYDCFMGLNVTKCLACTGTNCNKLVHPTERLSCHVCSSDDTATCETQPNASQICPLYLGNDQCVTMVNENGSTVRGCRSTVECEAADTANCRLCSGANCNTVNLKRKGDGNPGMWQDLPLTCYSCSGETDCQTPSASATCSETNYCMTVFGANGLVERRGCNNDVEKEYSGYCDANSANCHNCNSNKCNSATNLSDYVECVYCDSESNDDCAINPSAVTSRRKCQKNCMTALYPRSANSTVYELSRSCLDDKDVADQTQCQQGDRNCVSCSTEACNLALLPEKRLSCYTCEGDTCEQPPTSACNAYQTDDQCFILFNANNNIERMGCTSDLTSEFIANNIHKLILCSDRDNCNDFGNVPVPTYCVACNSLVDSECATNPSNIPSVDLCTTFPRTECYTRVSTSDGSTMRGCIGSLSTAQMSSCLYGNDTTCSACTGDRCNALIFPADRRSCQRCNSRDDPSCESNSNSESVCPMYDNTQGCGVKLVNGFTYRGCSREFVCDDSEKQYCRMCYDSNGCNFVDLASSNIGYPGKWQGLPINCYTCYGSDCSNDIVANANACQANKDQNCATVFDINGTVVQRGCSDSIYANEYSAYCDKNPSFCKFCKSNGCNNVKSLSEYVDCLFCDGRENSNCVLNVNAITRTRSCHQKCMTALYVRDSESANPTYELKRSCLDDMDIDEREDCANGSLANCVACEGATCNKQAIPTVRPKCYACTGKDCGEPIQQECVSYRENEQCFILFDSSLNSVSRMGCASEMTEIEIQANRRQMILCNGNSCNSMASIPNPVSCASCNSLQDPNCAINPTDISLHTVCSDLPYTECYTRMDENGVTHRGCLLDLNDELFEDCLSGENSTCEVCSTNSCNVNVFPPNRLSCIRCDGAESAACDDNPIAMTSICPTYDEDEMCVTKVEAGRTIRGCRSELSCRASDIPGCRVCQGNNCNTVNLLDGAIGEPGRWQDLPLNCLNCEGDECKAGASFQICQGNNLQTCMTVFGADDSVQRRGCSDAVFPIYSDYCDEHSDKCFTCKSNGCNDAAKIADYTDCYFCDSAENPDCSLNMNNIRRTRKCHGSCMVALYPRIISNDPDYEMVRSCVDDMDLDDREACEKGEMEFCKICEGDRCNTEDMPEHRYECYKCSGDDACEYPIVQKCSSYSRNEQCYTLYNNESIIAMGCRSEYEMDVVTELISAKQMLICNEERCNSPETLPTPNDCSVCDSDRNLFCATNPNLVANVEKCTSLPYTECYKRITEFGSTERGCLSSLDTKSFAGCLLNTDGLCETCTGDKCNEIDVYPSGRLSCHQCSSDTDPECTSSPNSNTVCSLYNANDYCVSSFVDGITRRGCATTLRCDNENDARTCRTCNTIGCNTIDLTRVNAHGEPGKFQQPPINCLQCEGEEQCVATTTSETCLLNPHQNCMTIFNLEGKVVQRGCSDAVEKAQGTYCDANPDKCMGCNGNDCNTATSLTDYVQCIHCDSEKDPLCMRDVEAITSKRKCHKQCMTALYKRDINDTDPSLALTRTCWDDMDAEDRDACAGGTLPNCKVCNSIDCNKDSLPTTPRRSCYVCEGDGCQLPQAQSCLHYRAEDKCYIQYDENRYVVSMGCGSDFSSDEATSLLMRQRLWYCDGENCNTFDAQPSAEACVLCSSRTDTNCAVNPSTVTGATNCRSTPYTQCYSRVLSNGATERGCLSSLYNEEFLGCLNGTSTTCISCSGAYCNNQVFPNNRATCHTCDSLTDPNCAENPNSLTVCPIFDENDTCVSTWTNGVTYRGCSSSVTCSSDSSRNCVRCKGSGCNNINLDERNDVNIGKWQDLPLRCLSCSGDKCNSAESTEILTCTDNNQQECVTVFNEAGSVVRRGCSDPIYIEYGDYCYEGAENCYNCKSNECNTATSRNEFVDCIYCDTESNTNCLWNPFDASMRTRKCQGGCMTALYPAFEGVNPAYDLIRTCLNDKEEADQVICSAGQDGNCTACTGANCNTANVPKDRHQCNICKDDCEAPVSRECPLYRSNDQCFIWFNENNGISEMGCVSSFRDQKIDDILKTKRVLICEGENCNTLDKLPGTQVCALCDSADDVSCATNSGGVNTFETCIRMPYTSCFTRINAGGRTLRGCLSDLGEDDFVGCLTGSDDQCDVCSGNACNKEIFPSDRPQCHTCSSAEDINCASYPNAPMPCPFLRDSEMCVTVLNGNTTIRGCSSQVYCDAADTKACRACYGNQCNSIELYNRTDNGPFGLWQDLPLRCHTCVGDECTNSLGPAKACTLNNEQDCMTVFNANGDVLRRGCAIEVENYEDLYCRQNPNLCFKCKSNECNYAWELTEYVQCAFCDSLDNALCVQNPEYTGFDIRHCYKECMVAMLGDRVLRSCLDDREQIHQHTCRSRDDNNKICTSCTGRECNQFNFPADRLKCHVCSNIDCTASASEYCSVYDQNDFCFARYNNNGKVDLMGCGSSQSTSNISDWTAQNILYRCDNNECNELSRLPVSSEISCLSCDSNTNTNCAQNPTSVQTTTKCPPINSQCVVTVGAAGNTVRDCLSSLSESERECVTAGTCSVCEGDKCNTNIFPEGRRSCHICTSTSDESCAGSPNAIQICPIYTANERCVSKNTDGLIERGCESNLMCNSDDEETCEICDTDGCNMADLGGAAVMATSSLILTLVLAFAITVGLQRRY